jgi:hypothetical protein
LVIANPGSATRVNVRVSGMSAPITLDNASVTTAIWQ